MSSRAEKRGATGDIPPKGDGPRIPQCGQIALGIINEVQAKAKTAREGEIAPHRGDTPIIRLGDLTVSDSSCVLVLEEYHVEAEVMDDYSEDWKNTVTFKSALFVDLLSRIEPGKSITAEGEGAYDFSYQRDEFGFTDKDKSDPINHKEAHSRSPLMLGMTMSKEANEVIVSFNIAPVSRILNFKKE